MPARIHVVNRYCSNDYVAGAAVTFNEDLVTAKSPRTLADGWATIFPDSLPDGAHVLKVTPANTSRSAVGPEVAEDLPFSQERMFRSVELSINVRKGRIEAVVLGAGQEENGWVGPGTNQIRVQLQPIFFRGLGELGPRKHAAISLIVIHQTAGGGDPHGSLSTFISRDEVTKQIKGSPHYLVTVEPRPQVVKISRDNRYAAHAGGNLTSWHGYKDADRFSIGIENSHKTGDPWPRAQMDRLIRLVEELLHAYPSIPSHGVVGHSDVLSIGRECPGMQFDWVVFEQRGLGMIPRTGSVSLGLAYGGFFRLEPHGQIQLGNEDGKRNWGEVTYPPKGVKKVPKVWPSSSVPGAVAGSLVGGLASIAGQNLGSSVRNVTEAAVATLVQGQTPGTVIGAPIRELQTDLRDIGYAVSPDGNYGKGTQHAVEVFQKHFFSGSRLGVGKVTGMVDQVTADYIKRVRP